ncbi:hypothetical protein [Oceanidesulfovibrio indonesiensis]|nr:hypothetical protein [Oceanidesulfovibrio indonesiensis]
MKNIRFNHIALFVLCMLLFAILDSCQGMIESSGVIRVVIGSSAPVSGKLDSTLPDLERLRGIGNSEEALEENLTYTTDYEFVRIKFLELTGRLWRGDLSVPDYAKPGEFKLIVHQRGVSVEEDTPTFTVRMFHDEKALQADSSTFTEQLIGIKPLWFVIILLPLGIFSIYLAYKQNSELDVMLEQKGLGPIYKLAKRKQNWEVVFGLGSKHGISTGQELYIVDQVMNVRAGIVAQKVEEEATTSEVPIDTDIKPSYYIVSQPPDPHQDKKVTS